MTQGGGTFLRTLGHPVLRRGDGGVVEGLRRKDLALLAYLCVERGRPHSRARLAALLWGESREDRARHSLTQALGRLQRVLAPGALVVEKETVRGTCALVCDARLLLEHAESLDDLLSVYEGPFLEGFEAGFGSEEFSEWAVRRRAELRNAALRWLEKRGEEAEVAGDWKRALHLGERAVRVDAVWEQGHRRMMRALAAGGERNRALRHYRGFETWLAEEVGGHPDPETQALAARIAAEAEQGAERPPQTDPPVPSAPAPVLPPPPLPDPAPTDIPGETAAREAPSPEGPPIDVPARAEAPPRSRWNRRRVLAVAPVAALLLWGVCEGAFTGAREPPPGHGEAVRAARGGPAYLAFSETLWEFPDSATLERCTGGWTQRVRHVRRLPPWPRRRLPSVRRHPWQGGLGPVLTDHPARPTQHVAVGCVLAPIPDPLTHAAIFGDTVWARSMVERDSLLKAMPKTARADPYPVRRPGTLIQGANDSIKWVVYHGGALAVPNAHVLSTYCRSPREVVRVTDAEFRYYRAWAPLPRADPRCLPAHHARRWPR